MATIKEIKAQLDKVTEMDDPLFHELEKDGRSGVLKAIEQRKRQLVALAKENQRLEKILTYERSFYQEGLELVAGVDEVGRGPLAGPVVAAAVILPKNCKIIGLNDSKKIPKSKHVEIFEKVQSEARAIGIGIVDSQVIDRINILEATKLAMLEAISQLSPKPQALLIDALELDMALPQKGIIKGDANSASIAAASIVAKVTRDRLMADYDKQYPGFDFAQNAGYGTKTHLMALEKQGVTPIHRRAFEPIKSMFGEN